jgi:hypothetical protein
MLEKTFKIKTYLLLLRALFFTLVDFRVEAVSSAPMKSLTADEMSRLALKDSMYYHFDEWFSRFQGKINRLESVVSSLENRAELMKFHIF